MDDSDPIYIPDDIESVLKEVSTLTPPTLHELMDKRIEVSDTPEKENINTLQVPNSPQKPRKMIEYILNYERNRKSRNQMTVGSMHKGLFVHGLRGTGIKLQSHFNERSFMSKPNSASNQPAEAYASTLSQQMPLPVNIKKSPIRCSHSPKSPKFRDIMPVPKKQFIARAKHTLKKLANQVNNTPSQKVNQNSNSQVSQIRTGQNVLRHLWEMVEDPIPLSPAERALSESQTLSAELGKTAQRLNFLCTLSQENSQNRNNISYPYQNRNKEPPNKKLRQPERDDFDSWLSRDIGYPEFKLSPMSYL
ncbi:hypothetical protein GEMRC1_002847 [Eukaryota sp. GEM-RC1]